MKTINLKIIDIDDGFCRVTYSVKNNVGQNIFYCLQDEGEKYGGVTLYRSTADYEPSHQVGFNPDVKVIFERVPEYSSMAKRVNSWIENNEVQS